jgi:hypothetical protein
MDTIDLFGHASRPDHGSVLARTFEYPPFSVLSARDGWWQERKRQWLALGIKSELGRGGGQPGMSESSMTGLTWGDSPQITEKGLNYYRNRKDK